MDDRLLAVTTATAADADCLEAALQGNYELSRNGLELTILNGAGENEPSLSSVLKALEDCVTDEHLHPVKLEIFGRRYTMYARAEA